MVATRYDPAALGGPMTRVADMRSSLDSVAGLHGSLDMVAGLAPQLAAVASLRPVMQELSGLRAPMERVAALETSMSRLANLEAPMSRLANPGALLERPALLAAVAMFGLFVWSVVTFVAVRLAIISTSRDRRRRAADGRRVTSLQPSWQIARSHEKSVDLTSGSAIGFAAATPLPQRSNAVKALR